MIIFEVICVIYLLIGFVYATYILLFAGDYWYWFPINLIFGPIAIIYNAYRTAKKTKRVI